MSEVRSTVPNKNTCNAQNTMGCVPYIIHLTIMQVDLLIQGGLPPSNCTWHLLERAGYVCSTTAFLEKIVEVREAVDMSTGSTTDSVAATSMIQDATIPANEGYPQLICENIIAQTVYNLNRKAGRKEYKFLSKPVVKNESDRRRNKLGYIEFCCTMREHT